MARIKIHDLPMSLKVSREEICATLGGSHRLLALRSDGHLPNAFYLSKTNLLAAEYLRDETADHGPGSGPSTDKGYIAAPLRSPGSPSWPGGRS